MSNKDVECWLNENKELVIKEIYSWLPPQLDGEKETGARFAKNILGKIVSLA